MLNDLTKEQRFEVLKNEFTNDITYQRDMDWAYHNLQKIKEQQNDSREKTGNSKRIEQ